jgi:hypothetical protein
VTRWKDTAGDVWEWDGDGWLEPVSGAWSDSWASVDRVYGPLIEVTE